MSGNKLLPLEERTLPPFDSGRCPVYVRRLPPCKNACPSSEDIRGHLTQVAQSELFGRSLEESFDEGWHIITDKNPFPAVIGRICPHPCEDACNRRRRDWSVAIHNLERFIGDHGLERGLELRRLTDENQPRPVAIVGAGPSGLSCAYQLARRGYKTTVFEAAGESGGMLRAGIPSYRLPREVLDAEIHNVTALGVEIRHGVRIGVDFTLEELRGEYGAVYVAVGAHKGISLEVQGDDLPGVLPAQEFLSRANSGELHDAGRKVLVIGGGNGAIDAARVALRLGAQVTVAYRRTRFEMPAIPSETLEAEKEGIKFEFQAAPLEITATGADQPALAVNFIRTEPGLPDGSGRHRPVPVEGSGFSVPADTVIAAIGQRSDLSGIEGLADQAGRVRTSPVFETSTPGVFAGGDMLSPGFATAAIGQGRKAAGAIDDFLQGRESRKPFIPAPIDASEMRLDYYRIEPRNDHAVELVEGRTGDFREVNLPLTLEEAVNETHRCMSCGRCFVCDRCRIYCPWEAISKDMTRPIGFNMFTDYAKCSGCSICAMTCPCHYIQMDYGA